MSDKLLLLSVIEHIYNLILYLQLNILIKIKKIKSLIVYWYCQILLVRIEEPYMGQNVSSFPNYFFLRQSSVLDKVPPVYL